MRFLFGLLFCISLNSTFAADFRIGIWGNGSGAAEKYVNFHRYGCKGAFEKCEKRIDSYRQAKSMGVAYFSPEATVAELADAARKYSEFSERKNNIIEVSGDDFVSFLKKNKSMNNEKNMLNVISAAKSVNKNLYFAITLYENEVAEVAADKLPGMSPEVRKHVDRIAFYLRFRESVKQLENYIQRLKIAFPNAQIDVGLYNYDRTGRPACHQKRIICSHENDINLFKLQLSETERLKEKGLIQGIEIYPGEFGRERSWAGWKKETLCTREKFDDCVKNSEELSRILVDSNFLSRIAN